MKPDLLASLQYNQSYWLAEMTADDLGREGGEVHLPEGMPTARRYDVFGTANFFNFKPWAASVEYLLKQGIDRIAIYYQKLVEQFISGIDSKKYDFDKRARWRNTLYARVHLAPRPQA